LFKKTILAVHSDEVVYNKKSKIFAISGLV